MSVALTNGVNYSLKPTSVRATRKQLVIPSSNKTDFSPEDTCVFYLPSLRNNVMDGQSGFLRLTVLAGGADSLLDVSAHSLIERIMTYGAGGQLISDLQNYSVLATMMTDLQLSQSEKLGLSPILGTEDVYATTTTTTSVASTDNLGAATRAVNIRRADPAVDGPGVALNSGDGTAGQGGSINLTSTSTIADSNRKGKALTNGSSYTFCIPLLHPLFTLSEKMFPCFALADDTRVEITWSSAVKALVGAGATFTVKSPEIVVDYIEFDSAVFPMIAQTYAGRELVIPAQDYRYYSSQIAAGTSGNISQIIPCKVMSARAFFFGFRPAGSQVAGGYAVGSRVNPFWSANDNFRLNIGGVNYPQKPITTRIANNFSEWFASTQTALHAFNQLSMNGGVSQTYYQRATRNGGYLDGASSYQNAFSLGINLDTLRGQSETQNSGLNLSNITTYYEGFLAANPTVYNGAGTTSVSVDTYVLHDVMFIVSPDGNVSLRF